MEYRIYEQEQMINEKDIRYEQIIAEKEKLESYINELNQQKKIEHDELIDTINCLNQEIVNLKGANETIDMQSLSEIENIINSTTISYDENNENDQNEKKFAKNSMFYTSSSEEKRKKNVEDFFILKAAKAQKGGNKSKCPTKGCDGSGNTSGKKLNKGHTSVKFCPLAMRKDGHQVKKFQKMKKNAMTIITKK